MTHPFGEQQKLTGAALKDPNFTDFVEGLAAYRDEQYASEAERYKKALERLKAEFQMRNEQLENDHGHAKRSIAEDFELRQELTERQVETTLARGLPTKTGKQMAAWVLNGAPNDAYDRKVKGVK